MNMDDYGFQSPLVDIYILNENPNAPKQGHMSHGLDLYFNIKEPVMMERGRTYCMPTGIRMFVNPRNATFGDAWLLPRSSCSILEKMHKREGQGVVSYENCALRMTNTIALIDWDYRGEIQARVTLESHTRNLFSIRPDKAYVQLVPRSTFARFVVVSSLDEIPEAYKVETSRGSGGFGSTG